MSNTNEKMKLYFKKRKGRVSLSGVSINFDWLIILSAGGVVVLAGLVFATITYLNIATGTIFDVETGQESAQDTDQKKREIQRVIDRLEQDVF